MKTSLTTAAAVVLIASGCAKHTMNEPARAEARTASTEANVSADAGLLAMNQPQTNAAGKLTVRSAAFEAGGMIPLPYSDYGQKLSPALSWSQPPAGTKSIALIVEDPDAKEPKPFVHWLLYNHPAGKTSLRGGLPTQPRLKFEEDAPLQGVNSRGSTGWFGPRPPVGDPPHHYHFQVFALDTMLDVGPAADKPTLLEAMSGHVLAKGEIVGLYQQATPPRQ